VVAKLSSVLSKKNPAAPASKRQKRAAMVATSLEVHQPSSSFDNASSAASTQLFLFLILRFSYNLYSAGFDAEVSFSWC
jgi:hypothetical protein